MWVPWRDRMQGYKYRPILQMRIVRPLECLAHGSDIINAGLRFKVKQTCSKLVSFLFFWDLVTCIPAQIWAYSRLVVNIHSVTK